MGQKTKLQNQRATQKVRQNQWTGKHTRQNKRANKNSGNAAGPNKSSEQQRPAAAPASTTQNGKTNVVKTNQRQNQRCQNKPGPMPARAKTYQQYVCLGLSDYRLSSSIYHIIYKYGIPDCTCYKNSLREDVECTSDASPKQR